MTTIPTRMRFGPETFTVNVDVDGGKLVTPDAATGKIKLTTGPTDPVLGVTLYPARPAGSSENTTDVFGESIVAMYAYTEETAVAFTGVFPLTFAVNCGFGVLVYGAANGQVSTVATGAPRPIGMCVEPLGVVVATNPVGLVRLF